MRHVGILWPLFEAVENTPLEFIYLSFVAALIFLSTLVISRALLVVGALLMLAYIGYFTAKHFAKTLGWSIALIIIRVTSIGMSAFALNLKNNSIKT